MKNYLIIVVMLLSLVPPVFSRAAEDPPDKVYNFDYFIRTPPREVQPSPAPTPVNQPEKIISQPEPQDLKNPPAAPGNTAGILSEAVNFYVGLGGTVDQKKARRLFLKAGAKHDPVAEMWLARLYFRGRCGIERDERKAAKLADRTVQDIKDLAASDHTVAAFLLGSAYHDGLSVPQDYRNAVFWYRKAADAGDPLAMGNLGHLYQNGLGVPRSITIALNWFERAAAKNNALIINHLGFIARNGLAGPRDNQKAVALFKKAADMGYDLAMGNLGQMYENGLGISQNDLTATQWYERAALLGNPQAMTNLGYLLEDGRAGGAADMVKANYWYQKACSQDYQPGCQALNGSR